MFDERLFCAAIAQSRDFTRLVPSNGAVALSEAYLWGSRRRREKAARIERLSVLLGTGLALLGLIEALVHFFPVHGVPPCSKVVGTFVLVLQVIGVFPDVVAKDRVQAL